MKRKQRGAQRLTALLAAAALCLLAACGGADAPGQDAGAAAQSGEAAETTATADYPALVRIGGQLYTDSGATAEDVPGDDAADGGTITAVVDGVPEQDGQSNFGTGYAYRAGAEGSQYLCIDGGWRVFVPYETQVRNSDAEDWNDLSEEEKMQLDPTYGVQQN